MKCTNCGHDNNNDAKFCSQCGNSLSFPCPVCATMASPGDRYCSNCGASLLEESLPEGAAARPQDDLSRYLPEELLAKMRSARDGHSMEGERRTVTMLFADIQGSTSSAERLDPEDWAEIMNGAFERLIAPIYRYEGTLAQLRGDAVLAFFGAPIAHEDDPVRALRAGLEMVEAMTEYSEVVEQRWGVPAHVRVGINTGLVVVGAMGSDLRVEYTALGDAINVAARMEQTAEPDTVRVTGNTLSLTEGMFEAEELGAIEVKGKAEPVPTYRVTRFVGTRHETGETTLVGRNAEMQRLTECLSSLATGTGYIASIIAEAGVGKSRLLDELERHAHEAYPVARLFDQAGDLNWLSGASRSYDAGHHFATIGGMLASWWFADPATPDFGRIEAAVAAEGIEDQDMAAYLGYVAGVPLSEAASGFLENLETQVLNSKANEAVMAYLEAVAGRRPTTIVLEDLHWSDDLSLAMVESIMELCEVAPVGLLIAMRPYREEPTWRIHEVAGRDHHHRYTSLSLEPLDAEESKALLESLLVSEDLDPQARERILERSEGNPLYIEQMVRDLPEVGAENLSDSAVPSSLAGLLTARLDRLSESSRHFVQMVSVLGSEFDRAMMTALVDLSDVDGAITDLLKRGILVEVPGTPDTLAFRHSLIQEVAYETILRRTRRELHRRVADHLINSDGLPREIARHLMAAEETEAAYPYLVQAGLTATRSMALADAIELFTTAIENTPEDADPELIVAAHNGLGEAYALIPDLSQAAASYQRLYDFGKTAQRPEAQVSALNHLAYATATLGADLDRANSYLADARRLAEEHNDEIGLAEYHMNSCLVASLGGDVGTAVAHDEETVRLGEEKGVAAIRLSGLVRRAANYVSLLDFEHGYPAIEKALEEAREAGLEEGVAVVEFAGSATADFLHGEIREALDRAGRTVATLERFGSFYLAMSKRLVAECHYQLGDLEDALASYVDATRTAMTMNQPFSAAAGSSGMALVYATVGIEDRIPELAAEVEDRLAGPIGEFMASTALADLGYASLALGDTGRAFEYFTRGLNVSSATQFMEKPRLLAGRSLAGVARGDQSEAASDLAAARALVDEKSLGLFSALIARVEGRLESVTGDHDSALAALETAQEHAMDRGQRLMLIQILRDRAAVAASAGDVDEADAQIRAARTTVEAIAEGITDETLRESYLTKAIADIEATTV